MKELASVGKLEEYKRSTCFMEMKIISSKAKLTSHEENCRIWEYSWLVMQFEKLGIAGKKILDIGSERTAFPWYLSLHGADIIVSDINPRWWLTWLKASILLKRKAKKIICDATNLLLPDASVDACVSVSVIEHIEDKKKALAEAARVLRPGGRFLLTFDICEQEMNMSFPAWNGKALTMQEFDILIEDSPWFEKDIVQESWNVNDISDFLDWQRNCPSPLNYVVAGAVLIRNNKTWNAPNSPKIGKAYQKIYSTLLVPFISICGFLKDRISFFFQSKGIRG